MSSRPVYIPKRRKIATADNSDEKNASSSASLKRPFPKKQQQPRFHGAFTGGFSAGHFNTVGSKEGWMPSQVKKRDQKLEDFMDDEDHADWGGPTRLRDDYGTKPTTNEEFENNNEDDVLSQTEPKSRNSGMTPFLPLKSMLEISHQTVGPRLLRRLGWREGGMAIVPAQEHTLSTRATGENDNNDGDLSKVHLSRRRLRKIRLQSTRITNLPPPKLDQCGLGFEPYKNAPEFQRYRDQRKQQARDRATYTTRNNNNVYRISDVAGEDVNPTNQATTPSASGDYLSFETAEDFVGKRSAAGFALRDDEDDAYDDGGTYNNNNNNTSQTTKSGIHLGNEYNAEVYEHEDSDEDIPSGIHHGRSVGSKNDKGAQSFSNSKDTTAGAGNVFAAWAGTDPIGNKSPSSTTTAVGRTATFDGKAPLAGFRLGISTDAIQTRYAGPEIPRDYTIQRHEFAEHENPYVLEAISNAVRLEQKEQRNSRIVQQHQKHQPNQRSSNGDTHRPLTKNFSSLADAMKNRFTSSTGASEDPSKTKGDVTSTTSFPAGLHLPNPVKEKKDDALSTETGDAPDVTRAKSDVIIIRTVQSFAPNPLVCKRFCVPTPSNARRSKNPGMTMDGVTENTKKKNKEAVYFEREILLKARKQQQQQQKDQDDKKSDEKAVETMALRDEETNSNEKPKGIDRPSMEKLRSIFDASSDESESSSDDEDDDENARDENKPTKHDATAELNTETKLDQEKSNMNEEVSSSREIVEYQPKKDDETRNSSSSVGSNIDDDDSTSSHHRRRKRDKRYRRKHDHHHRSHRKRHKRKRSRSTRDKDYSDEDSEDNEEDREGSRAKRRPKEKKRKKKKHSSSSRHRSRKREKEDEK